MTRDEFLRISQILKSVFTSPSFMAGKEGMEVWYRTLQDLDYKAVYMAVEEYILTEEKQPLPASIRKKTMMVSQPQELNENEAWALVSRALRNGIYNSESEFNKLPPNVQKAVGSPQNLHNWATSDYEAIETVIASNFRRTYSTVVNRESEIKSLPQQMQNAIKIATGTNTNLIGARNEEDSTK